MENTDNQESVLELAKKSPTFCIYPFSHLATKTDGTFKLCCRSLPISNVKSESVHQLWNGEDYKAIRRDLLSGQKPKVCEDCWELEEVGTRSMRQRALNEKHVGSRWNQYKDFLNQCHPDGTVPYTPKSIELKLSNICNLRCRMCHPVDSTSWAKDWPVVEDLMREHNSWSYRTAREHKVTENPVISEFQDNEQWWKDFDDLVDSIDLVEFAGGEPLIDPQHYRILDRLRRRAPHIRLKYSTNLTRTRFMGKDVFDYWPEFKSVSLYASMDGINEVYDYIRTGASFPVVINNLRSVLSNKNIVWDELAVAFTIQVYNVFQLPAVIEFFTKMGVRFHSHRVVSPTFLSVQILPPEIKRRLTEEMLVFKEKIAREYDPKLADHLNKHINDHLKHMNGKDRAWLVGPFVEFTRRLDRSRGTDVLDAIPELRPLFEDQSKAFAAKPLERSHFEPNTTSSP